MLNQIEIYIKDLLKNSNNLTFLIGAGCSVDPPSCLLAGKTMMKELVKFTCPNSEIKEIIDLIDNDLIRFESLIEILRENFDKDLKIIDYYSQCNYPNNQHYFLAKELKKGNYIITTNFDHLIEHASINSGINKENIYVVITEDDFENYNNPNALIEEDKFPIYKIHGSPKNIITGEVTKDSLISTIKSLGKNKEGDNLFEVENFKRSLFENIVKNRSLIVMGYSGGDDFDIIPTLKILKEIKEIIWLDHQMNSNSSSKAFEIDLLNSSTTSNDDKINKILHELKKNNNFIHIYRYIINVSNLIQEIYNEETIKSDSIRFELDLKTWMISNFNEIDTFNKNFIADRIYCLNNDFNKALTCIERIVKEAFDLKDNHVIAGVFHSLGFHYYNLGDFEKANKNYELALEHIKKLNKTTKLEAIILNSLGTIKDYKGDYEKALQFFKEAYKISKEIDNLESQAANLNNIADVLIKLENFSEALKNLNKALEIDKIVGDYKGMTYRYSNIAHVYTETKEFDKAIDNLEIAIDIEKNFGNQRRIADILNNMGNIYWKKSDYKNAEIWYSKAFLLLETIDYIQGKAECYHNLGMISLKLNREFEAFIHFENALELNEKIGLVNAELTNIERENLKKIIIKLKI